MTYARFDDRWDDHRKIKRAWRRHPAAVALHAMAITYCNRHNNNGKLDSEWVEEKLALLPCKSAERERILTMLVDLELFERIDADTFQVHDFLDWNLSSEQRQALADQGRRGGHAKAKRSSHPDSNGSSPGHSPGSSEGHSEGSSTPTPTPTPTPKKDNTTVERSSTGEGEIRLVFDAWIVSTERTTATLLDAKRRRIIVNALKVFPVADLVDAVDGWRFSSHHRGENEQATVYNDLALLLRDAAHVEKFRDLTRGAVHLNGVGPARKGSAADAMWHDLNDQGVPHVSA